MLLACGHSKLLRSFGERYGPGVLLVLKDLFYTAAVPHRDKLETRQMLIPTRRTDEPSFAGYFGSFGWIIVVLIWVFVYLSYLQVVLPDYRWDIGDVCHAYILDKTNL